MALTQTDQTRSAEDIVEAIKIHINSFPEFQSHYSRRDNINRLYLGQDLNIQKLGRLYNLSCNDESKRLSDFKYREIFTESFNFGFATPKTDTCKVCDSYKIQLNTEGNDVDKIKADLDEHQSKADKAFALLKSDTEYSQKNPLLQRTLCFDLHQALPTPKLSSGPAFYKRKLWTYNLGIHDAGANKAAMMMWPETVAGRGSDEVGSCIIKFLNLHNEEIRPKKLMVYSDNCGGQNKNFSIMCLWQYLIVKKYYEEVQHNFPVSGHTMMPCDRDFGDIERVLRKRQCIYSPDEYYTIVKEA